MRVTDATRRVLGVRREKKAAEKAGFVRKTVLNKQLGSEMYLVIVSAFPSVDGKSVWIKTENRP
jgi:hypothetical protein